MNISLEPLSEFAFSLATCLKAGIPPRKALEVSGRGLSSRRLQRAVRFAAEEVDKGCAISEGLERSRQPLPPFAIPVIRAGELSGRLVESFLLIHEHARRLKPTLQLLRNTWLYPLACILFGWLVRVGILASFGFVAAAWALFRDFFLTGVAALLVGWALLQIRWIRETIDLCVLQLPLVRETIIRMSVTLFFATFRLGYDVGGLSVLKVFDLALDTVRNTAVRRDLAKARKVAEEQGALEDAFAEPRLLDDTIKSSIAAGAVSGRLGATLDGIVRSEALDLEYSLGKFNRVLQILTVYGVGMSIVGTLLYCLFGMPG